MSTTTLEPATPEKSTQKPAMRPWSSRVGITLAEAIRTTNSEPTADEATVRNMDQEKTASSWGLRFEPNLLTVTGRPRVVRYVTKFVTATSPDASPTSPTVNLLAATTQNANPLIPSNASCAIRIHEFWNKPRCRGSTRRFMGSRAVERTGLVRGISVEPPTEAPFRRTVVSGCPRGAGPKPVRGRETRRRFRRSAPNCPR